MSRPSKTPPRAARRLARMKTSHARLALYALAGIVLSGALAATRPGAPEGPQLTKLAWMSGHWASEADGTRTEEMWLAPAGGVMLAVNRSVGASGHAEFEYLRIEQRKDVLVYVASPGGKGATDFPLVDLGADFVVFENPTHDFPKQIRYELRGGALHARVSGDLGGQEQAMEWTWKKQ